MNRPPFGGRFVFWSENPSLSSHLNVGIAARALSVLRGTPSRYSEFCKHAFRERSIKRLVLAAGFLTVALAASTSARADYAVIQFRDGRCEIWQDSGSGPVGAGWTKLAFGFPDYPTAQNAIDGAFAQGACR